MKPEINPNKKESLINGDTFFFFALNSDISFVAVDSNANEEKDIIHGVIKIAKFIAPSPSGPRTLAMIGV